MLWLSGHYSPFNIKCLHVDLILTDIFERIHRVKSTFEFGLSKHTNLILKMTYSELRLTTILFQFPRHPLSRQNRLYLVLRWGGVTTKMCPLHSCQHGPEKMRDVLPISLAFTWHLPHQHLEEPERGGCPLGQKCYAEIYVLLNQK